jgi:hypothetical protein
MLLQVRRSSACRVTATYGTALQVRVLLGFDDDYLQVDRCRCRSVLSTDVQSLFRAVLLYRFLEMITKNVMEPHL